MLVISRRPGERLQIEDIVLTVVRVSRGVAEVSLRKRRSAPVVLTLQADEFIDGCYNVRLGLVTGGSEAAASAWSELMRCGAGAREIAGTGTDT